MIMQQYMQLKAPRNLMRMFWHEAQPASTIIGLPTIIAKHRFSNLPLSEAAAGDDSDGGAAEEDKARLLML